MQLINNIQSIIVHRSLPILSPCAAMRHRRAPKVPGDVLHWRIVIYLFGMGAVYFECTSTCYLFILFLICAISQAPFEQGS